MAKTSSDTRGGALAESIIASMEKLAVKIGEREAKAPDVLHWSQSVVNLAQALSILDQIERENAGLPDRK